MKDLRNTLIFQKLLYVLLIFAVYITVIFSLNITVSAAEQSAAVAEFSAYGVLNGLKAEVSAMTDSVVSVTVSNDADGVRSANLFCAFYQGKLFSSIEVEPIELNKNESKTVMFDKKQGDKRCTLKDSKRS